MPVSKRLLTDYHKPSKKRGDNQDSSADFEYNEKHWTTVNQINKSVALQRHRSNNSNLIIVKTIRRENVGLTWQPSELRAHTAMRPCNRIVQIFSHSRTELDLFEVKIQITFKHYPLGDLLQWRRTYMSTKRTDLVTAHQKYRPIPESYLWRYLVHMSQALAFIHGDLTQDAFTRSSSAGKHILIHRDIKPENILVSGSGTYPSFSLTDFDCSTFQTPENENSRQRCGTYQWQGPENPFINTTAADVWSMGAVLHWMMDLEGSPPIDGDPAAFAKGGDHPPAASSYTSNLHYYRAALPRRAKTFRGYTDEVTEILLSILKQYPEDRPSAVEILQTRLGPTARQMLREAGGAAAVADLDLEIDC
ncbi:kinase-like protein [Polyplosphaeria fusca]|uniref:Kinase-like protein n=1 Tax=Polyplosphaeria fusca TaxID=682080 RepID=A0A9P4R329_9PLEO|nr:kinase-like protein [Polyplosphaeria fusca]